MKQITRRHCTDESKIQVVALAESVERSEAARQLDISVNIVGNWLNASRVGRPLGSPSRQPVGDLESELARIRAEVATLKLERDIQKKKRRRSSPRSSSEVRLRRTRPGSLSAPGAVPRAVGVSFRLPRLAASPGPTESERGPACRTTCASRGQSRHLRPPTSGAGATSLRRQGHKRVARPIRHEGLRSAAAISSLPCGSSGNTQPQPKPRCARINSLSLFPSRRGRRRRQWSVPARCH